MKINFIKSLIKTTKKLSYKNLSHPLDEDINRRVIIQLEYNSNIKDSINKEITSYEKNLDIKIKSLHLLSMLIL